MSTRNRYKDVLQRNRIESAISMLITFQPLYGVVFLSVNKREDYGCKTMAVGPINKVDLAMFYNPDFTATLSKFELQAVLKHEALHLLLHHISRASKFSYNPRAFNIAADLAINSHISQLPEGCLMPSQYGWEDNRSSDWYYRRVMEKQEDAEKNNEPCPFGSGDGGDGTLDDHSKWGDCDQDIIEEKIRKIAEDAIDAQNKKGWGDVSGDLSGQILEANRPKANWKKEVRYFISKLVQYGKRSTRLKDNRRTMEDYPFLNPGKKKNYTSRILVAFDTSASVSDRKLKMFVDELSGMIDCVLVDTIMFDTKVYDKPVPFDKRKASVKIVGRGGTCFNEPALIADELKYDGLIIMTDGDAPEPPKPRARVLWCLTSDDASRHNFSFGRKVVLDMKD